MFGFVTKAQLDAHADELRREVQACREDQAVVMRKIKLEWEEWWEKFSRLYARLSKRVSDSQRVDESAAAAASEIPNPAGPANATVTVSPERLATWRARRGF